MTKSLAIDSGALAVPEPDASGVRVYKGIPYAAPPIGSLRWRPPEPVAAWTGVRPTDGFGSHSVQGVVWDDIDLRGAATSEDCLTLNIWTPAAPGASASLPTMVWIHGGGFVVGSGAEPRYDGARLAARGIVVVTVNHRLNALGFLAHPELTAESDHHASGIMACTTLSQRCNGSSATSPPSAAIPTRSRSRANPPVRKRRAR